MSESICQTCDYSVFLKYEPLPVTVLNNNLNTWSNRSKHVTVDKIVIFTINSMWIGEKQKTSQDRDLLFFNVLSLYFVFFSEKPPLCCESTKGKSQICLNMCLTWLQPLQCVCCSVTRCYSVHFQDIIYIWLTAFSSHQQRVINKTTTVCNTSVCHFRTSKLQKPAMSKFSPVPSNYKNKP